MGDGNDVPPQENRVNRFPLIINRWRARTVENGRTSPVEVHAENRRSENRLLGLSSETNRSEINSRFTPILTPSRHWPGGIAHTGPEHPHFASVQARLRTFNECQWPTGLKQSKHVLADAGLFYLGTSDRVKCFYCNGVLNNWQEEDDPWQEHAGWFPYCSFVRMTRGQEFVDASFEFVKNRADMKRLAERVEAAERAQEENLAILESIELSDEDMRREYQEMKEQNQCKVCLDRDAEILFLPCGLLVACATCSLSITNCAVCRTPIEEVVKVYK